MIEFDWARRAEMVAWRDHDPLATFERRLGLPTFLENAGSAACAAELVLNVGSTPQQFFVLRHRLFHRRWLRVERPPVRRH